MSAGPQIHIGRKTVGWREATYIVAEIGTNHNGSLETAKRLLGEAAEAGADAAKLQYYCAGDIVNRRIRTKEYGLEAIYGDTLMYDVFESKLRTPQSWFPELIAMARGLNMGIIATVHSPEGVKTVTEAGFDAVKVASMDLTNLPLLEAVVATGNLPVILSTGMANLDEICEAVRPFAEARRALAVLHCVSNYPCELADMRLRNIVVLQATLGVPVGFSDHSPDNRGALVAVGLGARILEKHLTLDRSQAGPDHPFALEPEGFAELVSSVRQLEASLADEGFRPPLPEEWEKRALYRRSIVAAEAIKEGEVITERKVKLTRPGDGLPPKYLRWVIGRRAARAIAPEEVIRLEDV
jgi:sialic acid synthase SpsE